MIFILSGLLIFSWALVLVYWRRQTEITGALRLELEKIEAEEIRMFDFLHGLGEAFSAEVRPEDLHRVIVEGAMRILNADGAALYLFDPQGAVLIARFLSKGCPPLVAVPAEIKKQAESNPQMLQSWLQLHSVEPGEGVLGKVWGDKEAALLAGNDSRLVPLRDRMHHIDSALLAPLLYGEHNLGVLAVANTGAAASFSENELEIFKAITEQSAFALYNAIVYTQVEEKKRMDLDLTVAQDIQRILLPSSPPVMGNFEIDGINLPARQMSGDYYGYIRIDDQRWGIAIADVSGKGVPASLIMAMCRSVLRCTAPGNVSAADVLHKVNRQLFPDIKEDMFISMAYVILDEQNNTATMCRAGHDAPLLYSARDQTVSKLNPPGMALGIDSGQVFARITSDFTFTLEPNDCLILYTDGVTEALDSKGLEFGMKRMIQSIQAGAPQGASGIKKRLTEDLASFVGTYPQNDDITLIVIRKT